MNMVSIGVPFGFWAALVAFLGSISWPAAIVLIALGAAAAFLAAKCSSSK